MYFTSGRAFAGLATSLALLTGCYTPPKIHTQDFSAPKTIAIVEPAEMKNIAMVGVFGVTGRHFVSALDSCFIVGPEAGAKSPAQPLAVGEQIQASQLQRAALAPAQSIGASAVSGAAAGAMAGLIQGAADDTFKKSQNYHEELLKRVPGLSLKTDLVKSLRAAFEAKGIQTSVVVDSNRAAPRLRWPARDTDGEVYPADANEHLPAVDADILMQISPIALWNAPGQLNNYRRMVGIGVALYNGRTKKFLGTQTFVFNSTAWQDEYARFESLVAAGPVATNQMRDALLSLVPQIVSVVSRTEPAPAR